LNIFGDIEAFGTSSGNNNYLAGLHMSDAQGNDIVPHDGKCLGLFRWANGCTENCQGGQLCTSGLRPVFKLKPNLNLRLENGVYELDE